jgi:phosphatidylglycerophosphate synthase
MRPTADDVRLAAAVKPDDGFFATFFVSTYSPRLVRRAARARLTPNQITIASLVVGLGAAAAFAAGTRADLIAGAVLLQLSFTLDVVDGQLARYTGAMSEFGAWFDGMVDRGKEYAVYAGLAIGSSRGFHHDVWALAGAAVIMQTTRHYVDFSYAAGREPVQRTERRELGYWVRRIIVLPIGERLLLISLTAAIFRPAVTFAALLSWGGLATAYTLAGRLRRAFADASAPDAAAQLEAYCDDGVASRLVRRGPRWLGPPLVRVTAAAVPWLVVLGLVGRPDHRWPLAPALAWLLVWGGALRIAVPLSSRYDFLVPSLVFVAESVGVLRLSAIADDHDLAAGFALLVVVVLRRYDLVYRHATGRPTRPAELFGGGWQIRLLVAYALAVGGVVVPGEYVVAGFLAALLASALTAAWQDPEYRRGKSVGAAAEELS